MKKGLVYLIGAGPGDPELITVKAMRALEEADCIVYDYLANPRLIERFTCEKIYAGKQGGNHTLAQDEISALIVKKAREGKTVARLKGGDPFIFGRGGEEAEELVAAGIRFEVVPGVSSFYSAPAYAGIPLTHRDFANAFEVITGHRRDDAADDEDINFPEYDPDKTYAFLMGMKNIAHIASKLVSEKRFPAATPVAVVNWGTTPRQRVATGTLADIGEAVKREGLKPPAIILVGGVVSLRERLRWFDNLPLFGKKIVVTRTREQASALSLKLSRLGADVIEFPTIEIRPKRDMTALRDALKNIAGFDWLVFTSQNAVGIFFGQLSALGLDGRALHGRKIACIGPATAVELEKYFIKADLLPKKFVAESLVESMGASGVRGARILLPCAQEARDALRDGLVALGAVVERIPVYDTARPEKISAEMIDAAESAHIVTFTSSSTAKNYFSIVHSSKALHACIGPVTADTVRQLGYGVDIEAGEYTIDGLVEAIVRYCGAADE